MILNYKLSILTVLIMTEMRDLQNVLLDNVLR